MLSLCSNSHVPIVIVPDGGGYKANDERYGKEEKLTVQGQGINNLSDGEVPERREIADNARSIHHVIQDR